MDEKHRTVEEVRADLDNLVLSITQSSKRAYRTLKRIDFISLKPDIKTALEIAATQLSDAIAKLEPLQSQTTALYMKAITDGLTRLFNRGYFEEVIKPKIERTPNAAVMLTDIDHFGRYNNTYGHQQADHALRTVADAVRSEAKTNIVARYGGEEFSILLTEYPNQHQDAPETAERVRAAVENAIIEPFSIDAVASEATNDRNLRRCICGFLKASKGSQSYAELLRCYFPNNRKLQRYLQCLQYITISVGMAVRKSKESAEHLIYRADKALYEAKHKGRNCVKIS
ncbi:Diguanylate cyclase, GGDEF domain [uncultured archaeon]|nr:Diguanylate cyclase, GGDEF domain [uncultured archaeon]